MLMQPLKDIKLVHLHSALTTGQATTSVAGNVVDMAGFEGALVIGTVGNNTTVGVKLTVQNGTSTTVFNTTCGTVSTTAKNGIFAFEVVKPTMRYLRTLLDSTAESCTGGVIAILYGAHVQPTTQASTDLLANTSYTST